MAPSIAHADHIFDHREQTASWRSDLGPLRIPWLSNVAVKRDLDPPDRQKPFSFVGVPDGI